MYMGCIFVKHSAFLFLFVTCQLPYFDTYFVRFVHLAVYVSQKQRIFFITHHSPVLLRI